MDNPDSGRPGPRRGPGLAGAIAGSAACLLVASCASIDSFSGRMTTYNTEAERSQDQAIMLNVLRAAEYRPLSFTELQTVSATLTPSATLSLAAPLAQNGAMTPTTLSPTLGLTGGPTIQAGYINTQDFYRGILQPVPMGTIDLLVQRRIPSTVLFNLLFSRVIVRQIPNSEASGPGKLGGTPEVFMAVNDLGPHVERLEAFQDLVEAMLNEGLTTGPGNGDEASFGPPLTELDLAGGDLIAKAAGAGLQVEEADWCDLSRSEGEALRRQRPFDFAGLKAAIAPDCETLDVDKHPGESKQAIEAAREDIDRRVAAAGAPLIYRLAKAAASAGPRFCMAGPRALGGSTAAPSGICRFDAAPQPVASKSAADRGVRLAQQAGPGYSQNEKRLCDALNRTAKNGADLDCRTSAWMANGLEVDFEPRSTYSLIYYLGEVERRELQGRPLLVKVGDPSTAIPEGRCSSPGQPLSADPSGYRCSTLFYLRRTRGRTRDYLAVNYDGRNYAVSDNDPEEGKTNEVLDIVNELVALNHSAKDAPTSSLLTVVGVH